MITLAQTPATPTAQPIDLLKCIPELEKGIPAEALESSGISPWLLWGGSVGLILLIGLVVFLIIRKKKTAPLPPSAEEIAMQRLEALRTLQPDLRACGLELSMILREYLAGKTEDPALYETHEEFSRRLDALSAIPRECQYATRMLLEKFVELKYAGRQENAPQLAAQLIAETEQTILNIQEAQQKAAEAAKELEKVRKLS
ncbi:MAG: hypothetical protein IKV92_02055 [Akkermansia sp.]|nr:hypothetical protein [Akkermansia sp.]